MFTAVILNGSKDALYVGGLAQDQEVQSGDGIKPKPFIGLLDLTTREYRWKGLI